MSDQVTNPAVARLMKQVDDLCSCYYHIKKPDASIYHRGEDERAYEQMGHALRAEIAAMVEREEQLRNALADMLYGWRYIRHAHGDLYGVGWDRAQEKAESALRNRTPNPAEGGGDEE